MEYKITKTVEVTPILVSDSFQKNAERVGSIIKNFGEGRELEIVDYVYGRELLILVTGNIGNAAERLLVALAGISTEESEHWYEAVNRAAESVRFLDDEEAAEIINTAKTAKTAQRYMELDQDLTSVYS
jgi:hypothetical protein